MPHIVGAGFVVEKGYTLELAKASVGKGWNNLIEEVFKEIKKYPHLKIVQVKEKWGRLRIYLDQEIQLETSLFENDESVKDFWFFLTEIEMNSGVTCEECGAPGSQTNGTWIRTLCQNCVKKGEKNESEQSSIK